MKKNAYPKAIIIPANNEVRTSGSRLRRVLFQAADRSAALPIDAWRIISMLAPSARKISTTINITNSNIEAIKESARKPPSANMVISPRYPAKISIPRANVAMGISEGKIMTGLF